MLEKRTLVTTALEDTWPTDLSNVVFLGEWCRLYARKTVWEKAGATVAPYHWNDRKKLHNDYQYLKNLYETLLVELTTTLNKIHGVNHTIQYWRILIGPWLGYFTEMVFDRWAMLVYTIENHSITNVICRNQNIFEMVPNDMEDFHRLFPFDEWNEAIYAELLKEYIHVRIDRVEVPIAVIDTKTASSRNPQQTSTFVRKIKNYLVKKMQVWSGFLGKSDQFFLISSYLPISQDIRLQLKLRQIPKLWISVPVSVTAVDIAARSWTLNQYGSGSFEDVIRVMIPKQIPIAYLEGYKKLQKQVDSLNWPRNPKTIFTSNNYSSDDIFKAWAGEKKENGSRLLIGQHGGSYGISLWGFTEEHQLAIADDYISWGWKYQNTPNAIPFGNLKLINKKQSWNPKGNLLLVNTGFPQYSYHLLSMPIASQAATYFENQFCFTAFLPAELRRKLVVRLFGKDFGWSQKQRWIDRHPDVTLDEGKTDLSVAVSNSRLYVSTYNATSFLESLFLNIPTIVFWDPVYWEIRNEAMPFFDLLEKVGIFHSTPASAAAKIVEIWDDVESWWNQSAVQEARNTFCYSYSRAAKDPIGKLAQIMKGKFNETAG